MASLNRALIIGNLGVDPELRHTAGGHAVMTLRVATSHISKDTHGQTKEMTDWHSVVVWGKQAEACAHYLTKGQKVFVEGRLQTRVWEGVDGTKHYTTEIVASQVRFLSKRPNHDMPEAEDSAAKPESTPQTTEFRGQQPKYRKPHGTVNEVDIPF